MERDPSLDSASGWAAPSPTTEVHTKEDSDSGSSSASPGTQTR